jgi:hypothetical protein
MIDIVATGVKLLLDLVGEWVSARDQDKAALEKHARDLVAQLVATRAETAAAHSARTAETEAVIAAAEAAAPKVPA